MGDIMKMTPHKSGGRTPRHVVVARPNPQGGKIWGNDPWKRKERK